MQRYFKRETDVTGWTFNALVHEKEVTRNPLGPLQGWGQQVSPLVC